MAEIIGTTVGVVGFLGQLFDGCVKAYSYFSAARNLDTDSQRLICKVRIEEMRLVVWGREWGVAEGRFEAHLGGTAAGTTSPGRGTISRGNPQLMALATQILEQLHGTVTDFAKLKERYGLDEEGAKSKTAAVREKGAPAPATTATTNGAGNRSWKRELGLRTKWVISDKDKFGSLLVDLKGRHLPQRTMRSREIFDEHG